MTLQLYDTHQWLIKSATYISLFNTAGGLNKLFPAQIPEPCNRTGIFISPHVPSSPSELHYKSQSFLAAMRTSFLSCIGWSDRQSKRTKRINKKSGHLKFLKDRASLCMEQSQFFKLGFDFLLITVDLWQTKSIKRSVCYKQAVNCLCLII